MSLPNLKNFYDQSRGAKKVVVVDLGVLGDTVQLIPALWEIKRHYPGSALHVVSSPLGTEVLRLAPCVDRLWPLHVNRANRSLRAHLLTIRGLRGERFDVAFNFIGNDRGTILTGLTGATWRAAHAAGRDHFWNHWLVPYWVPRQDIDMPVFEQHRQVLAACGFNLEPARFDLKVGGSEMEWSATVVPADAIHLSINSGNPYKECPVEFNVGLLKALWGQRPELKVVATTGAKERERERLRKLVSQVHDDRLVVVEKTLSVTEFAAVIARCRLHVGPDSGGMHLAVALNVPTVSFFRQQGAYKCWMPQGPSHSVLSVPCECIDHQNAPCERQGFAACLARIEPVKAAQLVLQQLARP
jgi:ADP-heptose:LPS heptosyltransferase